MEEVKSIIDHINIIRRNAKELDINELKKLKKQKWEECNGIEAIIELKREIENIK